MCTDPYCLQSDEFPAMEEGRSKEILSELSNQIFPKEDLIESIICQSGVCIRGLHSLSHSVGQFSVQAFQKYSP